MTPETTIDPFYEENSDLLACLADFAKQNKPKKGDVTEEILTPYFAECLKNNKMANDPFLDEDEAFTIEAPEEPEIKIAK